jgi:hypothetical protein
MCAGLDGYIDRLGWVWILRQFDTQIVIIDAA